MRRVVVYDHEDRVREQAARRGLDTTRGLEEVAGCDLVVLATPVDVVVEVAREVVAHLGESSVLTDVASVKSAIVDEIEALWPDEQRVPFVGGHPMAGSEIEGVGGADADLFQAAAYVLTPTPRTLPTAFRDLGGFIRLLGARVYAVDPATHDRLVAVVSHVPQVLASALVTYAAEVAERDPALLSLVGGGFRDATRVAASSPELWRGILGANREAVAAALAGLQGTLERLRSALLTEDDDDLIGVLNRAQEVRRGLSGKIVGDRIVDLVIPVEDRPGSLAEVANALGSAGVNIEDLAMRHHDVEQRGALIVSVSGLSGAERAREVLSARGYTSHLEPR